MATIKPIVGTWFLLFWDYNPTGRCQDIRYDHWEPVVRNYTEAHCDAFMEDLASIGQKYLVLVCSFSGPRGRTCVYPSQVAENVVKLGCEDALEAVFTAADHHGLKIFATNDFYNSVELDDAFDEACISARNIILDELNTRYGHHESFYGWYLSKESYLCPYFKEDFIRYVNESAAVMRRIKPEAKILIAPYGTRLARFDDTMVDQLKRLDCDIIAYQDCVGCLANTIDESQAAFANLRKAHDAAGRAALWADVETFDWDNGENRHDSRLISTSWDRLKSQLAAVSPYVDEILVFSFQGLLTNPNSIAYCGYEESARLYGEYTAWLKDNYPEMLK